MSQQQQAIYDARTLGTGKMLTLGLQHMFAMFGATVLVPVITGLSMSATLLFAGLGTLLFHLLTKMRVQPKVFPPPSPFPTPASESSAQAFFISCSPACSRLSARRR